MRRDKKPIFNCIKKQAFFTNEVESFSKVDERDVQRPVLFFEFFL